MFQNDVIIVMFHIVGIQPDCGNSSFILEGKMEYSVEDFKKYILGEPGACKYSYGSVYECLPEAVGYSFCEANDFECFKIGMYHGTDRFVWEMDASTRKQYMDALKTYVDACGKNEELNTFLSNRVKQLNAEDVHIAKSISTYSMLNSIKNKNSMYEYHSLYFTPHLQRAGVYAESGRKFGEIGSLALHLWNYTKQENIRIETDSDTEKLLEEWYHFATERKPEPIIVKLKPEAFFKIDALENGEIFDAKESLDLKYKYLYSVKRDPNDVESALNITFHEVRENRYVGFRVNRDLTDSDFTVLDWEEKDREIKQVIENKDQLIKKYYEYVNRFCLENEKKLNDEEFVKGLKEHFGLKTLDELYPRNKETEALYYEWLMEDLENEGKNNGTIQ